MVVAQIVAGENLRLLAEATKRRTVNDAVAVALKRAAIGMWWLGVHSALRVGTVHRVRRKSSASRTAKPSDSNAGVRTLSSVIRAGIV